MYQIIQPTPDDFDELTCLWEASVRATHHFIPEAYIQKLKPLVWSVYLHSMPLYMIRDNAGIEGFMGINGTMLEMLFVHPRAIGTGIGKQLMRYALEHCHVRLCRCKRTKIRKRPAFMAILDFGLLAGMQRRIGRTLSYFTFKTGRYHEN